MDGWKLVPVELLERATRDFTGRPSWDALEDIRLKATEELRAIVNTPTPPNPIACHADESCGQGGGEVELLGYRINSDQGHHFLDSPSRGPGIKCVELVDRVHVTRLQAEITQLRGTQRFRNSLFRRTEAERDALQSRLTQATAIIDRVARHVVIDVVTQTDIDEFRKGETPEESAARAEVDRVMGEPAGDGGYTDYDLCKQPTKVAFGKCWQCLKTVTLAECQEADGECPHCSAEIHKAEDLKP